MMDLDTRIYCDACKEKENCNNYGKMQQLFFDKMKASNSYKFDEQILEICWRFNKDAEQKKEPELLNTVFTNRYTKGSSIFTPGRKGERRVATNKKMTDENEKKINDFKRWLEKHDSSDNTVRTYTTHITLFFQEFSVFSKENFKTYIKSCTEKGLKPQTINLKTVSFNKYCEFRKKKGLQMKGVKIQRKLHLENIPSESDYNKILDFLKRYNEDYYLWVRVLATTGLRISEFLQLTWENIISGECEIKGKGNKYRHVFFSKQIQAEVKDYAVKNNRRGYFAINRHGNPMSSRGVGQMLAGCGRAIGLPKGMARPHAFRHYFAKQFLKNSKNDIVQLSEYLGHDTLETTRIYTMKTKSEQKRDFNKFVNW